jgi:aerotaxis receptor
MAPPSELLACVADATGRIRLAEPAFAARIGGESLTPALVAGAPCAAVVELGPSSWAMALATPAPDDGYLIVAFAPSTPLAETARERYAGAASRFVPASQTAFMRAALIAEAGASERARGIVGATPLARAARDVVALVGRLRTRIAHHGALAELLARKSGLVGDLAEEIRLFALNAILAAHRLADGEAIGAVAGLMKTRSDAAGPEILALGDEIARTLAALEEASFLAAAAKIEVELLSASLDADAAWVAVLADAVAQTIESAWAALEALEAAVERLAAVATSVDEHLKALRFLELQGRIEAARADDTAHVRTLFEEIGRQVRTASRELQEVANLRARRESAAEVRRRLAALRAASRTARRA